MFYLCALWLESDVIGCIIGTAQPISWHRPAYELDPSDADDNGFINEDFIVWMRTAALPNFRKLYRIIHKNRDRQAPTLPRGNYTLEVTYSILPYNASNLKFLSFHFCSSFIMIMAPICTWSVHEFLKMNVFDVHLTCQNPCKAPFPSWRQASDCMLCLYVCFSYYDGKKIPVDRNGHPI